MGGEVGGLFCVVLVGGVGGHFWFGGGGGLGVFCFSSGGRRAGLVRVYCSGVCGSYRDPLGGGVRGPLRSIRWEEPGARADRRLRGSSYH